MDELLASIKDNIQNPHGLSEIRIKLAGIYAYKNGLLTEILLKKPSVWNEIKKAGKLSDTATERAWQATEMGMQETRLRQELKSIDKNMPAIKTQIDLLKGEKSNL